MNLYMMVWAIAHYQGGRVGGKPCLYYRILCWQQGDTHKQCCQYDMPSHTRVLRFVVVEPINLL